MADTDAPCPPHCCCCGPGEPCCDCGEVQPAAVLRPFHVTTTCRATIREHWLVQARDATHATEIAEDIADGDHRGADVQTLMPDETVGDETERNPENVEPYEPTPCAAPTELPTGQLATAMQQLRLHRTQVDPDGAYVGVSQQALDIALAALAEVRPGDVSAADALRAQQDEFMQLADSAMRMEVALRMIRQFGMGDFMLAESGAVRDWLRDWIDGNHHGPVGGPMLWPASIGAATRQLVAWGFSHTPFVDGKSFVVLKRAPAEGELVQ